ncbi:hypothetical protein [Curtobacterium ammoniigenes]|uniref:hypothetical protein n=1 Tax=Curtobacterium ammoniigenes TaxID=395387 RepID=UPI00082D9424|nr:hypothetical protein [Curtobacterium ammoniigenes]
MNDHEANDGDSALSATLAQPVTRRTALSAAAIAAPAVALSLAAPAAAASAGTTLTLAAPASAPVTSDINSQIVVTVKTVSGVPLVGEAVLFAVDPTSVGSFPGGSGQGSGVTNDAGQAQPTNLQLTAPGTLAITATTGSATDTRTITVVPLALAFDAPDWVEHGTAPVTLTGHAEGPAGTTLSVEYDTAGTGPATVTTTADGTFALPVQVSAGATSTVTVSSPLHAPISATVTQYTGYIEMPACRIFYTPESAGISGRVVGTPYPPTVTMVDSHNSSDVVTATVNPIDGSFTAVPPYYGNSQVTIAAPGFIGPTIAANRGSTSMLAGVLPAVAAVPFNGSVTLAFSNTERVSVKYPNGFSGPAALASGDPFVVTNTIPGAFGTITLTGANTYKIPAISLG